MIITGPNLHALRLPLMAAPMSRVSSVDLIIACCRAGVIGGLQALNAGTPEGLDEWYGKVAAAETTAHAAGERFAPFMVNLYISAKHDQGAHQARLDVCRRHKAPFLLTTAGNPAAVVEQAHSWGGRVFHDATTIKHVERAVAAGVDGLMLVTAGSGGLSGALNPFAFLTQARSMFDGVIILAGGIADGRGMAAALMLGADMVCMGTRFVATQESAAPEEYRAMLVESGTDEVLYTDAIGGIPANFLTRSLIANGLDPKNLPTSKGSFALDLPPEVRPWQTLWSAGHTVGLIKDAPTVEEVVQRLSKEFDAYATDWPWLSRLETALSEPRKPL